MSAPAVERHVRVTIEGTAAQLSRQHHLHGVLRLVPDGDRRTVLLVDPSLAGVTVEDVPAGRTWSPGDVVAGDAAVYLRGRDGTWRGTTSTGLTVSWTDAEVTEAVAAGPADGLDVLRYQAGGDA